MKTRQPDHTSNLKEQLCFYSELTSAHFHFFFRSHFETSNTCMHRQPLYRVLCRHINDPLDTTHHRYFINDSISEFEVSRSSHFHSHGTFETNNIEGPQVYFFHPPLIRRFYCRITCTPIPLYRASPMQRKTSSDPQHMFYVRSFHIPSSSPRLLITCWTRQPERKLTRVQTIDVRYMRAVN